MLKRLSLAFHDFVDVKGLAIQMQDHDLHWGSLNAFVTSPWIMRACCGHIAVAYSRPFVSSFGEDHRLPVLGGKFLRGLPEEQRLLHKRLINLRHSRFEHRDSEDFAVRMNQNMGTWFGNMTGPKGDNAQFAAADLQQIHDLASELATRALVRSQSLTRWLDETNTLPKSM